ncbi:MAG: hypothetical protein HY847_01100 [Betaproteobacteria bacterium]|nr:hypothetical protein [Betaproteobacteria bacterium]
MTTSKPTRILIADDNLTMRMLLRGMLLSDPGIDIEIVGEVVDGISAFEKAVELRPDLK